MPMNFLLAPAAWVFGAAATLRGKLFDWGVLCSRSYALPVVCVGNLAVGGTGKTPHVEHILRLLHEAGLRVAMLSRGYGRSTRGYILADGSSTARLIGDEPFQISRNCPFATVAVCERRTEGIERLLQLRPAIDVIVLDDAFQHRYVKAGLNVLLTEARRLYVHDHFLPWGRLREAPSAARRAQLVVVTKCAAGERPRLPIHQGQTLYYSEIAYGTPYAAGDGREVGGAEPFYANHDVVLIAGISNPTPLVDHIRQQGARSIEVMCFADHHNFTTADLRRIADLCQRMPEARIVTTQKDAARLQADPSPEAKALLRRLVVQPISVNIHPDRETTKSFNQTILDYVRENQRNSCLD